MNRKVRYAVKPTTTIATTRSGRYLLASYGHFTGLRVHESGCMEILANQFSTPIEISDGELDAISVEAAFEVYKNKDYSTHFAEVQRSEWHHPAISVLKPSTTQSIPQLLLAIDPDVIDYLGGAVPEKHYVLLHSCMYRKPVCADCLATK